VTKNTTHRLELSPGRVLEVSIFDTDECVYFTQTGERPELQEVPRVVDFLRSIFAPYEDDPRPVEIHSPASARRIETLGPGCYVARSVPVAGRA
jgi:hypothetical protein